MRLILALSALFLLVGCLAGCAGPYAVPFNATELEIMVEENGEFPVTLPNGTRIVVYCQRE